MKRYLAVIPARGGSKGVPHKNIVPLNGVPLIGYTAMAARKAQEAGYLTRCVVSTDSPEIARIARDFDMETPFLRPAEISGDNAKSIDAILHALDWYGQQGIAFDAVITLQATSPLRTGDDIVGAVRMYESQQNDSLISVYLNRKANGYNYYRMGEYGVGLPLRPEHNRGIRRQDMPDIYVRNGAMYISSVGLLRDKHVIIGDQPLLFVMPPERSIDIDALDDYEFLNWRMQTGRVTWQA